MLNREQVEALLKPINPKRIMQANGQSHVPAYDVAAHLTRVLGFGNWDTEILSKGLLFEESEARTGKNKDGTPRTYSVWTVGYVATIRLTIKDEYGNPVAHWENGATGDAINQPSRADAHHLALTTAISTALKRCAAFGLGDQFGLSLYNKGSAATLVGKTLVMPGETSVETKDLESHIPKPESLGNDERQESPALDATLGTEGPLDLHAEIRNHPKYAEKTIADKQEFLSSVVGYSVAQMKDLSDDDAQQVLAKLRTL